MAAIVQKNKRFCVVYSYIDDSGKRKQKWESFKSMPEAKRRQKEVEYKEQIGTFIVPKCKTLDELLKEYVDLYGKTKWSMSTYNSNTSLMTLFCQFALRENGEEKLWYKKILELMPKDDSSTERNL